VSLTERIAGRIADDQYVDTLPDYLREQVDEDEGVDPESLDLAVPTGNLYPNWTGLQAFATTLAIAAVLWPALLIARGHLSPARFLAGDLPFGDLLTGTIYVGIPWSYWYGYLAVALTVGTGVSAALWYVWRAPPGIRDRLGTTPLGAFITAAVISGLAFLLAPLAGWLLVLGALIATMLILLGAVLSFPLGLYGLLKEDPRVIAVSVGAFVAGGVLVLVEPVWPSGVPVESYGFVVTYVIALLLAAVLPSATVPKVSDDLEAYRERLGKVRIARNLLEVDIKRLQDHAPADYSVEVPAPSHEAVESAPDAEAAADVEEAFDLVDAYERHLDVRGDPLVEQERANVAELLSIAAAVTHPQRCVSPSVAVNAADTLADFSAVCERFEDGGFDDDLLTDARVWEVCNELKAGPPIEASDVQRLRDACEAFEDQVTALEQRKKFRERIDEIRSGLTAVFDDPPAIDLDADDSESLGDREWERLERFERLLALARRASDLRREYPETDLPEALLATLREDAVDTDDLDPYDLLIEVGECALEAANEHGAPFDRSHSQVLDIAQAGPAGRAEELDDLQEVLNRGTRIAAFLDRVDHDHPSVEAEEWQEALATAVDDAFPNVLRPVDSRVEAFGEGMWERSDLFEYDWHDFESLVGSLYSDQGYDVEVTTDTNDGGVDVWARSSAETVAIQVKQHSPGNTVGRRVLQQLASTIAKGSADRVVVVTSAEFADTAVEYAAEFGPEMDLVNGNELVRRLSASDLPPPRTIEA